MHSNLFVVARFTGRDMARPVPLVLWGLCLVLPVYTATQAAVDPLAVDRALAGGFASCVKFSLWYWTVLAALSVRTEINAKTLTAVLVRPVSRWQYVLGRAIALLATLALFVACTWLGVHAVAYALHASPPNDMLRTAALQLADGAFFIAIAVPLGAILTPRQIASCLAALAVCWLLQRGSGPVGQAARELGYWLTPVSTAGHEGLALALAIVGQWAYAAVLALSCLWRFETADLPLRP